MWRPGMGMRSVAVSESPECRCLWRALAARTLPETLCWLAPEIRDWPAAVAPLPSTTGLCNTPGGKKGVRKSESPALIFNRSEEA